MARLWLSAETKTCNGKNESKTKKKLQGLKIRATIFEGILNIFWPNNNKNKSKQIADANKVQIQNLNEDWIWNTQQERINSEGHEIENKKDAKFYHFKHVISKVTLTFLPLQKSMKDSCKSSR